MSEAAERALKILQERGPMTSANVGVAVWGQRTHRKQQAYCRPASRLLASMEARGEVRCIRTMMRTLWFTPEHYEKALDKQEGDSLAYVRTVRRRRR